MIKPGDWVVLTGKNWPIKWPEYEPFAIRKYISIGNYFGFEGSKQEQRFVSKDGDWEVKRIQDYFEPGDEMRTEWPDGAACSSIISKWDGDKVWFVEGTYQKLPFDGFIVRNLTKEKEANMPKEKPTHLTVDDLYLTAKTPACPSTRQSFIETFGFKVQLNDPKLKDWIIKKGLEKDVKDNLPDHYAVIFEPEWQPTINEIVWVQVSHEWVGRYVKKSYNQYGKDVYQINGQWGDIYWLELDQIKPISERPFQVGDTVWDKVDKCLKKIENADRANENKNRYELDISPAIPEVK